MKLPNKELAQVELRKINGYLLNLNHEKGAPKAAFFRAFGFDEENNEAFEESLLRHASEREISGQRETEFGINYELSCTILTPDLRNPCIKSVWVIENGKVEPRLVTAFPD